MEVALAKFYLDLVFVILLIISLVLVFQIKLKQNLEKDLVSLNSGISPNHLIYELKFKKGQIFLRKKIYNEAITEFCCCFNTWDKNDRLGLASLLNTLGFMYFTLKEYNTANYYYRTCLLLTPNYLTNIINLAYVYQKQGYMNNLKVTYQELVKIAPTNKKTLELGAYLNKRLVKSE